MDDALSFSSEEVLPFDADLKFEVGNLVSLPGLDLSRAKVSLSKSKDGLKAEVTGRNAGDRDVSWKTQFERRELELVVEGELSGAFELEKHLFTDKGLSPLAGVVELSSTFSGAGRSPSGLISALTGEGEYELKTPSLSPLDPVGFSAGLSDLRDANQLDRLISGKLFAGSMPFTGAKGQLKIENGVVQFSKLPLSAEGATGHVATFAELSSGKVDISATLKLDAVKGLPTFEVALAGLPSALETTRDLTAVKSYIGVNVLQKGLDKLEELQREADRLFRDEMNFAREQVKQQLQREAIRKAKEEEERRKAEEERLRQEIAARELAEAEAKRLAEELEKRKIEEQARELQRELERQLAEEEAKRLAEEAKSRTRLEKHIRRVEDNQRTVPDPEPTTRLTAEPEPVPETAPETALTPDQPTDITPRVIRPQPSTGSDVPKSDR